MIRSTPILEMPTAASRFSKSSTLEARSASPVTSPPIPRGSPFAYAFKYCGGAQIIQKSVIRNQFVGNVDKQTNKQKTYLDRGSHKIDASGGNNLENSIGIAAKTKNTIIYVYQRCLLIY